MRSYSVFIFILFLTSLNAFSQEPVPRFTPISEFLNKNKSFIAYDVEFDSRGYAVIASNQGIFLFNGVDIWQEKILIEKKVNQYVYALYKGYNGDVWLGGPQGVSYLKKDSIISYPVPDSILKMARRSFESVYMDKNGLLHLAPRDFGYYTVDKNGNVSEIMTKRTTNIHGMVVTQLADKSWFHFSIRPDENKDSTLSVYYLDGKQKLKRIVKTTNEKALYESALVQHKNGDFSLSTGCNNIVRFSEKGQFIREDLFDYNIIKLFVDSRNDLWIGSYGQGAFQAKNSDLSKLTKYFKGNFAVVAESYDGGLWIKSNVIGLAYLSPKASPHYSPQNGFDEIVDLIALKKVNNKIFLTWVDGKLRYIENNKLAPLSPELSDFRLHSRTFCFDPAENTYWLYAGGAIYGFDGVNTKMLPLETTTAYQKKVLRLKTINGRVLGITPTNVFEIVNDEIVVISDRSRLGYFADFTLDDQGNIWIAAETGLWHLNDKALLKYRTASNDTINENFRITWNAKGAIWALTEERELFRFNQKTAEKVIDQNGNPVHVFSQVYDGNNTIWGTTLDYQIIKITDLTNPDFVHVDKYELELDNVSGMGKLSLTIMDNDLYLASAHGLFKIPINKLKKGLTPAHMHFRQFVNNEELEFSLSHTLDYFENDIRVEFDAINFKRRRIKYNYMLVGYDTTWTETQYGEIRYTNLSPGTYQLKFRSKMKGGEWVEAKTMTFTIKAPFWETALFQVSVVLLSVLLIVGLMMIRVRNVRRKEMEKSKVALELVRLEMRALKAQINPHFIFNSITSAMFYLAKNENQKVESYLQRFSKLVRKILESSDKSHISLIEEIELIRLYVKLESEQFDGEPISLDVSYDGTGVENAQIPPTLIQPYIENSIQHGLKKKQGERYIHLSFKLENELLRIQIEDNGIGRAAARKEKPFKENKSFGMLISSRRIELLNKNTISHVQVDDLYDENNNPIGTRVSFNLPLIKDVKRKRARN